MRVMAIATHPDDETLGCGGTLLKHLQAGDSLYWVLVTSAQRDEFPENVIRRNEEQVEAVRSAYPFASLDWFRMPTTRMDAVPLNDLINKLRAVLERVRPEVVYIPSPSDVHSDHRITSQASLAVLKSFYLRRLGIRRVLICEVLSETDAAPPLVAAPFQPNVFVDISETLERKIEIFSLFQSEVHAEPLPRNTSTIRAQARVRGASVGVAAAEAFMLVRELR